MFDSIFSQSFWRKTVRQTVPLTAAALAMSACALGDTTSMSTTEPTTPETSVAPTVQPQTETTAAATQDLTVYESEWPGELSDISPDDDSVLAVVGVQFDDVLNVRTGPGTQFDIGEEIEPTGSAIATGKSWQNGGFWYEVTVDNVTGWAARSFFAYVGPSDDATTEVTQTGGNFEASTLPKLGKLVANTQVSKDVDSSVTQVSDPTTDDSDQVIYDVLDIGDDGVYGFRLRVTGQQTSAGSFELISVERITLCSRGITNGLCS